MNVKDACEVLREYKESRRLTDVMNDEKNVNLAIDIVLAEIDRLRIESKKCGAGAGCCYTGAKLEAAEAEIERLRGGAVPVGIVTEHDSNDHNGHRFMVIEWNRDMLPVGTELYTAPPAPAVPDDALLLDALTNNHWKIEPFNRPTGGDDADVGWRVIEYRMPSAEVEIARIWSDDPREAIRAAMLAAAPEVKS